MNTTQGPTVAEIASNSLGAVRVFERLGIDYCCGGKRPLADVCRQKGYDLEIVQKELDEARAMVDTPVTDWNAASLRDLVSHIVTHHHEYLRRELPAIAGRIAKVDRVYNQRYGPTPIGLAEVFRALQTELEAHILKEEKILFPAIVAYETEVERGVALNPNSFGTVANPIRIMKAEHESAGDALTQIRVITGAFSVPEYACTTYKAMIAGLQDLEKDLHLHIHLENNILFPRALQLETARRLAINS